LITTGGSDNKSSNTWWIVLLALLALGLIGYGLYYFLKKRHNQ